MEFDGMKPQQTPKSQFSLCGLAGATYRLRVEGQRLWRCALSGVLVFRKKRSLISWESKASRSLGEPRIAPSFVAYTITLAARRGMSEAGRAAGVHADAPPASRVSIRQHRLPRVLRIKADQVARRSDVEADASATRREPLAGEILPASEGSIWPGPTSTEYGCRWRAHVLQGHNWTGGSDAEHVAGIRVLRVRNRLPVTWRIKKSWE